jgi:hypothetical protein
MHHVELQNPLLVGPKPKPLLAEFTTHADQSPQGFNRANFEVPSSWVLSTMSSVLVVSISSILGFPLPASSPRKWRKCTTTVIISSLKHNFYDKLLKSKKLNNPRIQQWSYALDSYIIWPQELNLKCPTQMWSLYKCEASTFTTPHA